MKPARIFIVDGGRGPGGRPLVALYADDEALLTPFIRGSERSMTRDERRSISRQRTIALARRERLASGGSK